MLRYPSIIFPFTYYTLSWMFINVLPALSLATIYTHFYSLASGPVGACLGVSLMTGSIIGELFAGRASDSLVLFLARRNGGNRKPEYRLYLCTLSAAFMPAGLLIFGGTVGKTNLYIPLIGLGVGVFGLQIASTCLYAYVSDCYKPQTPESGVVLNLARGLTFVVGYFWGPLREKVGYLGSWGTYAAVLFVVGFLPVASLMMWGEGWRVRLGKPKFHRYL